MPRVLHYLYSITLRSAAPQAARVESPRAQIRTRDVQSRGTRHTDHFTTTPPFCYTGLCEQKFLCKTVRLVWNCFKLFVPLILVCWYETVCFCPSYTRVLFRPVWNRRPASQPLTARAISSELGQCIGCRNPEATGWSVHGWSQSGDDSWVSAWVTEIRRRQLGQCMGCCNLEKTVRSVHGLPPSGDDNWAAFGLPPSGDDNWDSNWVAAIRRQQLGQHLGYRHPEMTIGSALGLLPSRDNNWVSTWVTAIRRQQLGQHLGYHHPETTIGSALGFPPSGDSN